MIFIAVKFPVRPDKVEEWERVTAKFTAAVRAEPGNVFFEWSRSLEEENTWVLLESFRDGAAGEAHVAEPHFQKAIDEMSYLVTDTPKIINVEVPQDDWGAMGEVAPRS